MAASSFSGLKDLLNPPPSPNSNPITKPFVSSSTSPFGVDLVQNFEALSIEESALLTPTNSSFEIEGPSNIEKGLQKKLESESVEGNRSYHERNLGKEIDEDMEKKQLMGRKCFPPPISCLKNVKVGKPYRYVKYDKEGESYVVEEIKIPYKNLFRASREDGRLKLYLDLSDDEELKEN